MSRPDEESIHINVKIKFNEIMYDKILIDKCNKDVKVAKGDVLEIVKNIL